MIGATTFSLSAQAYLLGDRLAAFARSLQVAPALLLLAVLPHALPELIALFLPLAAWILASRRGEWDQLLAATFVTVAVALPLLVAAALVEVYLSPHLFEALLGARAAAAAREREALNRAGGRPSAGLRARSTRDGAAPRSARRSCR